MALAFIEEKRQKILENETVVKVTEFIRLTGLKPISGLKKCISNPIWTRVLHTSLILHHQNEVSTTCTYLRMCQTKTIFSQ